MSKRIGLLEKALGVKLLHRTTRRVALSPEGETVCRWAQMILADMDAMTEDLSSGLSKPKGTLRISASPRLGRNHVAPIVSLMRKRHPDLQVWLELLDRPVKLVEEGFDIDNRVGDVQDPSLIAHHVSPSPRVLCASPAYLRKHGQPKTLQDLAQHECLAFREREEGFGVWRMMGAKGWETVKVTGPMAADIVFHWAREGHGILLLANWYAAPDLAAGSLKRVLPAWQQPADVWAMTAVRTSQSAKVRVCLEFLKTQLAEGTFALPKV